VSKLIALGVEVAGVHQRFARVHSLMFGKGSYRLVLDALARKRGTTYRRAVRTLNNVERKLDGLEIQLRELTEADCPPRGGLHLKDSLVAYCQVLRETVLALREICVNLADGEPDYRRSPAVGFSRFNQDKVKYDDCKSELERLGNRLNKLFASF
jgi:hypothetical protein